MFLKDPDAVLEYRVDWTDALAPGETIDASSWRVNPQEEGGASVDGGRIVDGAAIVRVGGGIPGHVYEIGNLVSFSDGTADERSLVIRVENR